MTRTKEQRNVMRTAEYREILRGCHAWKASAGVWAAEHRASRVMMYGATRAKARTNCALRVFDIGWEE